MDDVRAAYARVAETYADRLYDELDGKPYDRALLADVAERWRDRGEVCDVGCGPGHVSAFLADRGCRVVGIDLSEAMIEVARRRRPDLAFAAGDMLALGITRRFAAVVSFYSIVHFDASARRVAFDNLFQALLPGGEVCVAFHTAEVGADDKVHMADWWGTGAAIDFYFHPVDGVVDDLTAAGFVDVKTSIRPPYAKHVEAQTTRAYVHARRPLVE